MESYLSRYIHGEHESVWDELLAKESGVRPEPLYSDAYAVAMETMSRVKDNIEVVIQRLQLLDYEFTCPYRAEDERIALVYNPPPNDILGKISEIEARMGTLPLALRAWYEVVGAVSFQGSRSGWPADVLTDPLYVASIDFLLAFHPEYEEPQANITEPVQLSISPDSLGKAGFSGGTYDIALPSKAIDGYLYGVEQSTTFVSYVRKSMQWGGFPGFEGNETRPRQDLEFLSKDLRPI